MSDATQIPAGTSRRDALEVVVDAYEAALLRYATRLTGNPGAAEDVVQNAFIKLIRTWHDSLVPSTQLAAWLYRVAHSEAVDHVRREVRRQTLHAAHARDCTETLAADDLADDPPDRAAAAHAALDALSTRERQLVVLKVYERKSYREIAAITGLSSGNVGFILHHAMRKLAQHLQQEHAHGQP